MSYPPPSQPPKSANELGYPSYPKRMSSPNSQTKIPTTQKYPLMKKQELNKNEDQTENYNKIP